MRRPQLPVCDRGKYILPECLAHFDGQLPGRLGSQLFEPMLHESVERHPLYGRLVPQGLEVELSHALDRVW